AAATAAVPPSTTPRPTQASPRPMHVPATMAVPGAGNLEHDRLVALVQAAVDRRAELAGTKQRVRPPLVRTPRPGRRFPRQETEQYHVCLAAPRVSRHDRPPLPASILDPILPPSPSP